MTPRPRPWATGAVVVVAAVVPVRALERFILFFPLPAVLSTKAALPFRFVTNCCFWFLLSRCVACRITLRRMIVRWAKEEEEERHESYKNFFYTVT